MAVACTGRSNWKTSAPCAHARARRHQPRTEDPFAGSREFLGGFNLIEADSMDVAMRIAGQFPWSRFGSIEVRPVRDMQAVRDRVGAT